MATILIPMAFLHLIMLLAFVGLWRSQNRSRRSLRCVVVPFLLLTLLNTPPAAYLALGALEWRYTQPDDLPEDAGVIVILAGSVRTADQVLARPEPRPSSL